MEAIDELIKILSILRSKDGCSWDQKQTHQSLLKHLQEEVWEVIDAIQLGLLNKELKEELGDLLLQVVFHSQLAAELGNFSFNDVVKQLNQKLINRHPHVFDKENTPADFDIEKEWKHLKVKELGKAYHPLERIPLSTSAAYLFSKLEDYEDNDLVKVEDLVKMLQNLSPKDETEKTKQQIGKIFYALSLFCKSKNIDWEKAYKDLLEKKKQAIIENNKKA